MRIRRIAGIFPIKREDSPAGATMRYLRMEKGRREGGVVVLYDQII